MSDAKQVIENFLTPSGYFAMSPDARKAFIADNLQTKQLAKTIRSAKILQSTALANINKDAIKDYNLQASMLGWASDPYENVKEGSGVDPEKASFIDIDANVSDHPQDAVMNIAGKRVNVPKVLMGLSGLFGKNRSRPAAAADGSQNGQVSIAFLLTILLILWAGFAITTNQNGTKTTRVKLLGSVISGKGRVA